MGSSVVYPRYLFYFCFIEKDLPAGFPVITEGPGSHKSIEVGHNAVLQCSATGNPQPTVYWLREKMRLDLDTNPRYSILNKGFPGTYSSLALKTVYRWRGCCEHCPPFLPAAVPRPPRLTRWDLWLEQMTPSAVKFPWDISFIMVWPKGATSSLLLWLLEPSFAPVKLPL